MEKAAAGGVELSLHLGRTAPWSPADPDSILASEVAVTPQDVVYYMLSNLMDDAGTPKKCECERVMES